MDGDVWIQSNECLTLYTDVQSLDLTVCVLTAMYLIRVALIITEVFGSIFVDF